MSRPARRERMVPGPATPPAARACRRRPAAWIGSALYLLAASVPAAGQPAEACCLPSGDCIDVPPLECLLRYGGVPQGPGTECAAGSVSCEPLKWVQPPTYKPDSPFPDCFWGWDEMSHYGCCQIMADDWLCLGGRPVTGVQWWGSYELWDGVEPPPEAPEAFHVGIWTDVPASEDPPFSHPGVLLYDWVVPRQALAERWVGCDFHEDFPGPESTFRYDLLIPQEEWFQQQAAAAVYWVSISAIYEVPPPEHSWGWKTREYAFNGAAVGILAPLEPVRGSEYEAGFPLEHPAGVPWDLAFVLTTDQLPLAAKWWQPMENCYLNFDAASDLWWPEPDTPGIPLIKWEQGPDPDWPGVPAHDWQDSGYHWVTLADQWECQGGDVLDLHWWGNYVLDPDGNEIRGAGIDHFRLSIHADVPGDPWGLPGEVLWAAQVPFGALSEQDTGLVNVEGSPIYRYDFELARAFPQTSGQRYWFDIEARAVDPADPPRWRWQEAQRDFPPILDPAARRSDGGEWSWIGWENFTYSDLAFRTTAGLIEEVNRALADDFYSDGRPIQALTWWGSYFDPRYEPGSGDQLHQVDGWLISLHWADANTYPQCPPDLLADPPPTALGVYFAPRAAVEILPLFCVDCLGHGLYEYRVRLEDCCLLCSEPDPRTGAYPARAGQFDEQDGLRYWLGLQAVTGVEWIPPGCQMRFTGHLPSDLPGNDGHFWGWLSSQAESLPLETDEACAGRIVDFTPYPPHCWDYGEWSGQLYECPDDDLPVHMSFVLLAAPCGGDVDGDGHVDQSDLGLLLAAWDSRPGDPHWDPRADLDRDNHVGQPDLGLLLADWGCGRYVP